MITVPPYIGKLIFKGQVFGTGFLAHPDGLIMTCYHIVEKISADVVGQVLSFQYFDSSPGTIHEVTVTERVNPTYDAAVLQIAPPVSAERLSACFAPAHTLQSTPQFQVVGYGVPDDIPEINYEYTSASGVVVGPMKRGGIELLQLDSKQILPGMSGAPVHVEGLGVIGMISGRYSINPRTQTWMRDMAWAIKSEYLMALLGLDVNNDDPTRLAARAQTLLAALESSCDKEELSILAFRIAIPEEDLCGDTRAARARSLIRRAEERHLFDELIQALCTMKPFVPNEYDL